MTVKLLSQNETRLSALDRVADGLEGPQQLSGELFGLVDLLDGEPTLRRAFTDPSRPAEVRREMATKVLNGRVADSTLHVLQEAVGLRWSSGRALVAALERQGVRAQMRAALEAGTLDESEQQLFDVARIVERDASLREALGDGTVPLARRRELLDSLLQGRVSETTVRLASRAVDARERSFGLTVEHYLALAAALRDRQVAHVTVARPMTSEQEARMRAALGRQAGHDVDLQIEIDPSVIGGVRVVLGDDVIEGTVAGRLEDVRRKLA